MDTSLLYALADEERQEQTIRSIQQRVRGPTELLDPGDNANPPIPELVVPENGPQKANSEVIPLEDDFATTFILAG